ncbi:LCP family protein [Marinilactibacillus sp. GCM10026970]|uniref:LCP family glycopolymer transferase n=1 Tax=Marinilactibacillus sp. GCM10026970 TaxID=3252642 RepID=UPI0036154CCB
MDNHTRVKRKKKSKTKKPLWKKVLTGLIVFLGIFTVTGLFVGWQIYRDLQASTENMYTPSDQEQKRNNPLVVDDGTDAFSVLLLGIDTGDMGRVEQGRSDTMMVMTINPNTDKTTLVSIPRDTYTEISGRGTMDKINHAYAFGGTSMSVNTVQNLFDIPIDYYISINMEGLQQIVDAVGGITVTPHLTFEQGGYSFVDGQKTNMDGKMALEYSRMRKKDPNGDYGRQERQREVVQASARKMASVESVLNYKDVLNTLSVNMQTNLTFDNMVNTFTKYNSAIGNINQEQLTGAGRLQDEIYYEFIPDNEIQRVSNILKHELELN